jgi:hypothetical protein
MTEAPNRLEVEYDFVAIVDGLPENERQSCRISDRLKKLVEEMGFSCERADCNTKRGMIAALQHFRDRARSGGKFCLHFVCHGSENGLWIKSTNESIEWRKFRRYMKTINDPMGGSLILNMSTCEGLHGIKIVDTEREDLPFFGLIGVSRILFPDEAIRLNEHFYSRLSAGSPIQEVIREISKDPGGEVLNCITAAGYKRLSKS